jgi:hypothetical protein
LVVATALLGLVFAKQDAPQLFVPAFRVAAFVGAGSAIAAGVFAAVLIRSALPLSRD